MQAYFASDADGTRHVVLDAVADPSTWAVLVWAAGDDTTSVPPREERSLTRATVWRDPPNFLGLGAARQTWVAVVDHDEVGAVEAGGVRYALTGGRPQA